MIESAAQKLSAAQRVLIVGGGLVGVELAAEVADASTDKVVELVCTGTEVCSSLPRRARCLCAEWLMRHGVMIHFESRVLSLRPTACSLADGRTLHADIVYDCRGARVAVPPCRTHVGSLTSQPDGRLQVDDYLLLEGTSRVFVVGDAMSHRSGELRLAHTAELNAQVAARNLLLQSRGEELLRYPADAHGLERTPLVYCVSLGRHHAVLGFNSLVLGGAVPAVVKWLIEWTKVAEASERPVCILFWRMADAITAIAARVIR